MIRHEPAKLEDARRIVPLMREVDRNQILALGAKPDETVAAAIHMSVGDVWLTYFGDEIAALWGIVPCSFITGAAVPWLLTTPVIEKYPKLFYKESRRLMALLARHYGSLHNMIDVRHTASLRWAKRLGFTVEEPQALGMRGALFCKISMERT